MIVINELLQRSFISGCDALSRKAADSFRAYMLVLTCIRFLFRIDFYTGRSLHKTAVQIDMLPKSLSIDSKNVILKERYS